MNDFLIWIILFNILSIAMAFNTKDHVIPKAHGGTKARENMVDCCMICNRVKGCMTAEQFIQWAKDIVKLHGGKK